VAGRIRDSDIALVRERNQIDDVIGEYVALRQVGGGAVKGLCPFHDEKTPSFNVRPTHGTFHCFGCGEGGDVIAFLTKIDHLSFVEAVERLAERAGIKLTYEGGGTSVQRDRGTRTRPLTAPPPTWRKATYSPITSSIWLRSRTRAMSLSRIRPATPASLCRAA
jgi:DNA primase